MLFSLIHANGVENDIILNSEKEAGLVDQDKATEADDKPRYNFFGESLLVFIPIIDESVQENNEIERNIYPFGIGVGLEYRTYILTKLFSSDKALPGIMLGFTGTFYMMEPREEYQYHLISGEPTFGELTIFTLGLYTGYQFLIPVSEKISISPALFAGGRYYKSCHFFEQEVFTVDYPIIISGIDINIIVNKVFSLSIRAEYQIYIEEETRQIINFAIGSGIFF